jgi:dTDP-4-dehydrorhamnose 3,5-epimerase
MNFINTNIPGVVIIEPKIFEDERGYFFESFRQDQFEKHIGEVNFIQDNESRSTFGVLRGLHYQLPPFAQSKLLRVIKGKVLDVAVDIRKNSLTFGKHIAIELSADNKRQLFIPRGFAHGFVSLSDDVIFSYKCDNYYNKESEASIIYNDQTIDIDWKIKFEDILLSEKDKNQPNFNNAIYF